MPTGKPKTHLARILALLFCSAWLAGCGDAEVLHDLPEAEANQVLAVLQEHGIVARKVLGNDEENTWSVTVPRQSTGRAWGLLAEYKLPQRNDRRFRDVFGKSKLMVTPLEEQALFVEALQGEITHTLKAIHGVVDARVHLVLPKKDLTGRTTGESKASVVVEYQLNDLGILPFQDGEIQSIVAHAVEGLDRSAVSVVQKPTAFSAPTSGTGSDLQLVSVGPLVVERTSLAYLKAMVAAAALGIALLGTALLWQGREIRRLRRATAVPKQLPAGPSPRGSLTATVRSAS